MAECKGTATAFVNRDAVPVKRRLAGLSDMGLTFI
jgi:hypothetical protein